MILLATQYKDASILSQSSENRDNSSDNNVNGPGLVNGQTGADGDQNHLSMAANVGSRQTAARKSLTAAVTAIGLAEVLPLKRPGSPGGTGPGPSGGPHLSDLIVPGPSQNPVGLAVGK